MGVRANANHPQPKGVKSSEDSCSIFRELIHNKRSTRDFIYLGCGGRPVTSQHLISTSLRYSKPFMFPCKMCPETK
ncbi:Neuroligin-3 [Manis pentadactyla]|nr:Neuroligin-3 [Manis pentadactyla]